ncbi:MAG: glycosyltransferase family 2 protein [Candidatus Parvarchaeum sp.]
MRPVISIFSTVFNNVNIIEKSLNSVIDKFPDFNEKFELVIVDNYSTDGTYEKLLELQKKHKNIKIIREKCSRGKGRAIGFSNTTGKYVISIDCDTIYLKPFKNLVYSYDKVKDMEIYPCFFMKRKTMEFIGNFKDLNYDEDMELTARAISKGVKVYSIPCIMTHNQISKGREKRYAKGFGYYLRQYKNFSDSIAGGGLNLTDYIQRYGRYGKSKVFLLYLILRLRKLRIFRYSKQYNNRQLVYFYSNILNPSKFKIDRKYWAGYIYPYGKTTEMIIKTVNDFISIGLNKSIILQSKGKYLLLMYRKETDKKLIEREARFFEANVK